jgi:hypothetical protein
MSPWVYKSARLTLEGLTGVILPFGSGGGGGVLEQPTVKHATNSRVNVFIKMSFFRYKKTA